MERYFIVKEEYIDLWGDDPTPVLTMQEVLDICRGWECAFEDVKDQLAELPRKAVFASVYGKMDC